MVAPFNRPQKGDRFWGTIMRFEMLAARLACAAAIVCAAGAARADTVTFAIDGAFASCTVFDSGPLAYVSSTSCGRVTGTISLNRGTVAGATAVASIDLESWLPGDWGRAARYTYNVAGEAQDALLFTASMLRITTTDVFAPPADHLAAGLSSWTAEEETVLTLSYSAGGLAGQPELVFGASEAYGANVYSYNPYYLRADDGASALPSVVFTPSPGYDYYGNGRGSQTAPLLTAAEYSPAAAVPLPAALPLLALGLGAMGLAGRRRRG
jgi:hypothetical protein